MSPSGVKTYRKIEIDRGAWIAQSGVAGAISLKTIS